MKRTTALYSVATAVTLLLAGCSGSNQSPLSPSSVAESEAAANADGSTLKATAPTPLSPINGDKITSVRPTLTFANATGKFATATFAYRVELLDGAGNFIEAGVVPAGDGQSTFVPTAQLSYGTDYQWRVRAELDGATGPYSPTVAFSIASRPDGPGGDAEIGSGPRTPDPAPGQRLPLPNRVNVVQEMVDQYRGDLRNSCDNNIWMFRLVQRLRLEDTRWGLNWKRGVIGDMSQDAITYHYGPGPDNNSTDVYIIDVIGGHCGPNPGASWGDKTETTRQGGTIGRWTIDPYLGAGFRP